MVRRYANLRVRARQDDLAWGDDIFIAIVRQEETSIGWRKTVAAAKEVVLEDLGEHECPESVLCLDDTAAQILMDDLWRCGIRPTEGRGSAGQLEAVREHLADLRKLVFDQTEPRVVLTSPRKSQTRETPK